MQYKRQTKKTDFALLSEQKNVRKRDFDCFIFVLNTFIHNDRGNKVFTGLAIA